MSYREENGQVILTMSREDYRQIMFGLARARIILRSDAFVAAVNRINDGSQEVEPFRPMKKTLSAESRRKISESQKKRWRDRLNQGN
jgi:hypothetical protein